MRDTFTEREIRSFLRLYGFSLRRVNSGYGIKVAVVDRFTGQFLPPMGMRQLAEFVLVLECRLKEGKKLRLTDYHVTIDEDF